LSGTPALDSVWSIAVKEGVYTRVLKVKEMKKSRLGVPASFKEKMK